MARVAIFVDGGYLDKVLEHHGRIRVDYARLSDAMAGQADERVRTYYYHCPPWQPAIATPQDSARLAGYQKFAYRLNSLSRFEVREGRLQKIGDRFQQKGVDIQLAVDLLTLAFTKGIEKAILVTGDSDFVPVVNAVKASGVTVALHYAPQLPTHQSLRLAVDERVPITLGLLQACRR